MFSNVVDDELSSSGILVQGENLSLLAMLLLLVLIAAMNCCVVATDRSSRAT